MADYRARLDRIEAAIAPDRVILVWREVAESVTAAATRYGTERGVPAAEVLERGLFLSWAGPGPGPG